MLMMLEKIKSYLLIGSAILVAVLLFLLQRRNTRVTDLARELAKEKITQKLQSLENSVKDKEALSDKALSNYRAKYSFYKNLRAKL